jgi:hypothetical protein
MRVSLLQFPSKDTGDEATAALADAVVGGVKRAALDAVGAVGAVGANDDISPSGAPAPRIKTTRRM